MESVNFIKGYGKVINPSDDNPNRHRRRRIITALSLAVLLTLIVASLVAVLIRRSDQSGSPQPGSDPLRTVCSVTRYPNSCFSAISPLVSPHSGVNNSPLRYFNLSLHASLVEVSALRSRVAQPESEPAARDCAELLDDAATQLRRSAESIGGEKTTLTEMKRSDLRTWISAAMTDQETCVDGMEEMGSTAVGEVRVRVQRAQEYVSNTLAILNNISSLYDKFGLTMP